MPRINQQLDPPAIVREDTDLSQLAAEINAEHDAGEEATRKSLEHYKNAGEALIKAKKACGYGNWLKWLQANVRFDRRTATNYMRLASKWETVSHLDGLRDALRLLAEESQEDAVDEAQGEGGDGEGDGASLDAEGQGLGERNDGSTGAGQDGLNTDDGQDTPDSYDDRACNKQDLPENSSNTAAGGRPPGSSGSARPPKKSQAVMFTERMQLEIERVRGIKEQYGSVRAMFASDLWATSTAAENRHCIKTTLAAAKQLSRLAGEMSQLLSNGRVIDEAAR